MQPTTVLSSPAAAKESKPKRRACSPCHRSKSACDGALPCSRCRRLTRVHDCHPHIPMPGGGGHHRPKDTIQIPTHLNSNGMEFRIAAGDLSFGTRPSVTPTVVLPAAAAASTAEWSSISSTVTPAPTLAIAVAHTPAVQVAVARDDHNRILYDSTPSMAQSTPTALNHTAPARPVDAHRYQLRESTLPPMDDHWNPLSTHAFPPAPPMPACVSMPACAVASFPFSPGPMPPSPMSCSWPLPTGPLSIEDEQRDRHADNRELVGSAAGSIPSIIRHDDRAMSLSIDAAAFTSTSPTHHLPSNSHWFVPTTRSALPTVAAKLIGAPHEVDSPVVPLGDSNRNFTLHTTGANQQGTYYSSHSSYHHTRAHPLPASSSGAFSSAPVVAAMSAPTSVAAAIPSDSPLPPRDDHPIATNLTPEHNHHALAVSISPAVFRSLNASRIHHRLWSALDHRQSSIRRIQLLIAYMSDSMTELDLIRLARYIPVPLICSARAKFISSPSFQRWLRAGQPIGIEGASDSEHLIESRPHTGNRMHIRVVDDTDEVSTPPEAQGTLARLETDSAISRRHPIHVDASTGLTPGTGRWHHDLGLTDPPGFLPPLLFDLDFSDSPLLCVEDEYMAAGLLTPAMIHQRALEVPVATLWTRCSRKKPSNETQTSTTASTTRRQVSRTARSRQQSRAHSQSESDSESASDSSQCSDSDPESRSRSRSRSCHCSPHRRHRHRHRRHHHDHRRSTRDRRDSHSLDPAEVQRRLLVAELDRRNEALLRRESPSAYDTESVHHMPPCVLARRVTMTLGASESHPTAAADSSDCPTVCDCPHTLRRGMIVQVNREFERLLGWNQIDVRGLYVREGPLTAMKR